MSEKISSGKLSKAVDWLKEHTHATCPFCDGREWSVDDELSSILAFQQSSEPHVQTHRGYTMVLVTCEGCGFTAPFSAKKLGLEAG